MNGFCLCEQTYVLSSQGFSFFFNWWGFKINFLGFNGMLVGLNGVDKRMKRDVNGIE